MITSLVASSPSLHTPLRCIIKHDMMEFFFISAHSCLFALGKDRNSVNLQRCSCNLYVETEAFIYEIEVEKILWGL